MLRRQVLSHEESYETVIKPSTYRLVSQFQPSAYRGYDHHNVPAPVRTPLGLYREAYGTNSFLTHREWVGKKLIYWGDQFNPEDLKAGKIVLEKTIAKAANPYIYRILTLGQGVQSKRFREKIDVRAQNNRMNIVLDKNQIIRDIVYI